MVQPNVGRQTGDRSSGFQCSRAASAVGVRAFHPADPEGWSARPNVRRLTHSDPDSQCAQRRMPWLPRAGSPVFRRLRSDLSVIFRSLKRRSKLSRLVRQAPCHPRDLCFAALAFLRGPVHRSRAAQVRARPRIPPIQEVQEVSQYDSTRVFHHYSAEPDRSPHRRAGAAFRAFVIIRV